jgi:hypothetical protein
MERNFKMQTFSKQAGDKVKVLPLRLPLGGFSLFPDGRFGRIGGDPLNYLFLNLFLDELLFFIVEFIKFVVEFVVFIKKQYLCFLVLSKTV